VLDLGCGDGRLTVELAERGVGELVGIDLVEQAVAFARAFGSPLAPSVSFECVPVQALDAGTFDVAVVMEVLEHIPDDDLGSVVEATWQRVRDGGHLVVSVPTTNVPLIAKHERHYTEALLREQLGSRFEVESVRYVHRTGGGNRVLRRLLTNRLVTLEEPRLRRVITDLYRRRGWKAGPGDGAHLLAVCRRT
jgi:SAM-dependent methyltransferase